MSKASELVALTDSVFHCKGKAHDNSEKNDGSLYQCSINYKQNGNSNDEVQLNFGVGPKAVPNSIMSDFTQRCQPIPNSTYLGDTTNYVFVGENFMITMGGEIEGSRANAMRKLMPVVVYSIGIDDCS